jgi:cysteine desulfurase
MNKRPLYFDYAATTPVDERVIQVMIECLGFTATLATRHPAPTHSASRPGKRSSRPGGKSPNWSAPRREQIVWTSGATESNNLALKGVAQARGVAGGHIITSQIEHKAILDTARQLQDAGVAVTYLVPDADGLITPQAVSEAMREDTFLVSLMLVNNELGTVNDIPAIGQVVRGRDALFHVDAAQGAGKVQIDLAQWPVDLMSFSAHKLYGPKGIGALYVGPRAHQRLQAQIHGGGHEGGLRRHPGHSSDCRHGRGIRPGGGFDEEKTSIVRCVNACSINC